MNGCDTFSLMYNINDTLTFKIRNYQMPDSSSVTMVNDCYNKVKMATFLDSETILLQ